MSLHCMIPILLMNLNLLVLNGLRSIDCADIKSHFQMDFQQKSL